MTHEQLIRLALATRIAPGFFVLEQLESRLGRIPELSDLQAVSDDERKAIWDAMSNEYIASLANRLTLAVIAKLFSREELANADEAVARYRRAHKTDDQPPTKN
jgi:hypothetical protein